MFFENHQKNSDQCQPKVEIRPQIHPKTKIEWLPGNIIFKVRKCFTDLVKFGCSEKATNFVAFSEYPNFKFQFGTEVKIYSTA